MENDGRNPNTPGQCSTFSLPKASNLPRKAACVIVYSIEGILHPKTSVPTPKPFSTNIILGKTHFVNSRPLLLLHELRNLHPHDMETHTLDTLRSSQIEAQDSVPNPSTAPPRILPGSTEAECRLWLYNFILGFRKEYTREQAWNIAKRLQGKGEYVLEFSESFWEKYFEGVLGVVIHKHLKKEQQEYAVREIFPSFLQSAAVSYSWNPGFMGRIFSIMFFSSSSAVPSSSYQKAPKLSSPSPSYISRGIPSSESSMSSAHQTSHTAANRGQPISNSAPATRNLNNDGEINPRRIYHRSEV